MRSILMSEIIKLKGSKILWMVLVGGFLPALLILLTALNIQHAGRQLSFQLLMQNSFFLFNVLMSPPLFSLFAGFVVARENQDKTINQLFMYPQPRSLFFIGKWMILFLVIFLTTLLLFLLILLIGLFVFHLSLPFNLFLHYFYVVLFVCVLQWLVTPVAMAVSMIGKSYIPPMTFGVAAVVCTGIIFQSDKYNSLFPFSAIPNLMFNWIGSPLSHIHMIESIFSVVITSLISFLFCIMYYSRSAIHSG